MYAGVTTGTSDSWHRGDLHSHRCDLRSRRSATRRRATHALLFASSAYRHRNRHRVVIASSSQTACDDPRVAIRMIRSCRDRRPQDAHHVVIKVHGLHYGI
jgi:hypothetical protein